jgi:hypothetical protein
MWVQLLLFIYQLSQYTYFYLSLSLFLRSVQADVRDGANNQTTAKNCVGLLQYYIPSTIDANLTSAPPLSPSSLLSWFMMTPPNRVKMYQVRLVTKIRYIRIFRLKNLQQKDDIWKRLLIKKGLYMELDLQSLFKHHVHSCTHWQPPPPPRIWAQVLGCYWSGKIDDISFWPPVNNKAEGFLKDQVAVWASD